MTHSVKEIAALDEYPSPVYLTKHNKNSLDNGNALPQGDFTNSRMVEFLDTSSSSDSSVEDELRNLCCWAPLRKLVDTISHGGSVANVYNLASATLGAGIVTMPGGFHDAGIVTSVLLILVVCICTIYSLRILGIARDLTRFRSYEEMARGLFGAGWDYYTAFLMFVFCWGVCVVYVISLGDMLHPILEDTRNAHFLRTRTASRLFMCGIWLIGMLPLSLPKQINSLRYASFIGVMFIAFFVVCVIIHSSQNGLQKNNISDLRLFTSGMNAVNGLNLFIFVFICQVNAFEIYEEMHHRSVHKLTRDSIISMLLVAVMNFLVGFFGYCDFGSNILGSLLLMYSPRDSPMFIVSYIGICIKICVGFAICIQPSRDAIYYCLGWGKTSDVSVKTNLLMSGFLATAALICGLFVSSITLVSTLLGGICGGFLGFLFPVFFYLYSGSFSLKKLGRKSFILNGIGCLLLIVGGAVAVVFGTATAIYSQVRK